MRVYATFPNADYILKPYGAVGVPLRNQDGVKKCSVPPAAVMQDAEGACVWVVGKDGKAEKRRVVRGRLLGDVQFIESGLSVGERIVTDGTHKISPGDTVTPAK